MDPLPAPQKVFRRDRSARKRRRSGGEQEGSESMGSFCVCVLIEIITLKFQVIQGKWLKQKVGMHQQRLLLSNLGNSE